MARKIQKEPLRNSDRWHRADCLTVELATTYKGGATPDYARPNANVWFQMTWHLYGTPAGWRRGLRTGPCGIVYRFMTDGEVWFIPTHYLDRTAFQDQWLYRRYYTPPSRRVVRDAIRRYVTGSTCKVVYAGLPQLRSISGECRILHWKYPVLVIKDTLEEFQEIAT